MFQPDTKILVVDDMLTMRKIIMKQLKEMGFTNLHEAADGARAWTAIEKEKAAGKAFDLILSDWNMPAKSGLELLRMCRGEEAMKELPFVLITAESESSQVMEAIKIGVSQYIVKPFSPAQLKEKLAQTYQKHAKAS
jgi:two-component system chemotaxis response regulator CheY